MFLRRLDDYQSWQIQFNGTSILIDPWLTSEPISGAFDRRHPAGFTTLADLQRENPTISAVLLCTSVNDHLRPETLRSLIDIPVHGNLKTAKAARALGCTSTHAHQPGDKFTIQCPQGGLMHVTVTQTGLPLGLIAVGYLIEGVNADGSTQGRVWIEPHQPTLSTALKCAPVDICVLPTQSVVAVVLPVTAGPRKSARAALAAGARSLVPTASYPRRDMKIWQKVIYIVAGGNAQTIRKLGSGATQLIDLKTADWLDISANA